MKRSSSCRLISVVLAFLVISGCSGNSSEEVYSGKDVVIDHLEILGKVEEGYWVNEKSLRGRGDVAGPSDVWQEGVAVLEAAALEQIERAYGRDPVTKYWQPSVRSSLEGKVTFGSDWWTSAQFSEKAEQASGMSGSYYFESTSRAVIFKLKKSSTAN